MKVRILHMNPALNGMVGVIIRVEGRNGTEYHPVGVYSVNLPLPFGYQGVPCACHNDLHYPVVPSTFYAAYLNQVVVLDEKLLYKGWAKDIVIPPADHIPSRNEVMLTPFEV
jgi:hypothetical protein